LLLKYIVEQTNRRTTISTGAHKGAVTTAQLIVAIPAIFSPNIIRNIIPKINHILILLIVENYQMKA
jgi:hypothetical protein